MGKNTVNFACHHCGHCCTEVVCLPTPADVIRIARDTGKNPKKFLEWLTPEEIDGVDDDDPTWLECGDEKYMMALKRDEKKGCYFLDKKTRYCTIYESRPYLCRLYPFKVQETREGDVKGFTLHTDVGCPRNRDGKVDVSSLTEIYEDDQLNHEDYDDLVAIFNRRRDPDKKPKDFLKLLFSGL
jgi:Fe-S-cluster containining protein